VSTPEKKVASQRSSSRGSLAGSNIKNQALLLERRAQLVDVATRIMIAHGYNAVSVNELAEAAGMSIGSLYKYVRSKQDILLLVLDSIYSPVEAAIGESNDDRDAVEVFRETFAAFLRAVHQRRRGMLLMYREFAELSLEFQQEFEERDREVFRRLEDLVRRGNEQGVWNADPRLAAMNLYAVSDAWTLKGWLMTDLTIDQYVEDQTKLMLAMLGAQNTDSVNRQS
jgi:TetR/AcrR family transcriptional regulator, cholesterol catabolism regulator